MKYALVLEQDAAVCNHTSTLLSSIGYLVTPVFKASKALHAVQMIQFDLIVTWTVVNPGDRRCLAGELKRYAPGAILILLTSEEEVPPVSNGIAGVNGVLCRPFTTEDVKKVVEDDYTSIGTAPPAVALRDERRRRSAD